MKREMEEKRVGRDVGSRQEDKEGTYFLEIGQKVYPAPARVSSASRATRGRTPLKMSE